MGFGIFCLLFATTYCGATAALLINANEQLGTINDLAGILAVPDGKVCLMVSFERRFALRFPEFAGRLVPSITAQTVLQDFDDGKCIGALGGILPEVRQQLGVLLPLLGVGHDA